MYTVYKTISLKNSEYYIGVHKMDNPNDGYYGSGLRIKRAIKKYGKKTFKKIILFCYDNAEQAFSHETRILNECLSDEKCLNLACGGKGGANFTGKKHSDKTKKKLSLISSKRKLSKEARQKISESNRKRKISKETRKKLSDKAKQRIMTNEEKRKISESLKKYYREQRN